MMKLFFVYMLLCADKSHYVDQTDDLERRLSEDRGEPTSTPTSCSRA